ncbi:MAG: caspase family protein [Elusimicrobia bacterium]|nr:caspase family protein [Elusimicrobiota bacterium]
MNLFVLALLALSPVRANDACRALEQAKEGAAQMPSVPPAPAALLAGPDARVLIVGALTFVWEDSLDDAANVFFHSFDRDGRQDTVLLDLLVARGVPRDHIELVQDEGATRANIRAALARLNAASKPEEHLFVYYTGHGYKSAGRFYLAAYDSCQNDVSSGWSAASLIEDVEKDFKGSDAIVAVEACYSAIFAKEAAAGAKRVNFGILASTSENASSTAEWTFTEAILAALRGEKGFDQDADGKISFGELGAGMTSDMNRYAGQSAVVATTGKFDVRSIVAAEKK